MTTAQIELLEPFVAAEKAAEFLGVRPRHLVRLARAGRVPAYPLGEGVRRTWRFKLSELDAAMKAFAKQAEPSRPSVDTSYSVKTGRLVGRGA